MTAPGSPSDPPTTDEDGDVPPMDTTTLPQPEEELALPHLEERLLAALHEQRSATPARPTPASHSGRRRVLVAAAAATVVGVGLTVAPWGVDESSADAMVRDTAVATRTALADTGRATVSVLDVDGVEGGGGAAPQVTLFEFAGDDERYQSADGGYDNRIVDGDSYIQGFDGRHPEQWYRVLCNDGVARSTPDPRDLAGALTPDAEFAVVGEEVVDGVRTTHLRAGNPAAVSAEIVGETATGADVVALEIWVDGDDVTRRLDAEVDATPESTHAEWSVRFSDLGDDIDIAAPAQFEDETC